MEQPQGDHNAAAGRDSSQKIIPQAIVSSTDEKQAPQAPKPPEDNPKDEKKRLRNTWILKTKRYLLELASQGPDRHIELFLALVIAFFAFMQWHTAKNNNDSTTQQTDQLITAAKINATAAQQNASAASSFASTEEKINEDLANAVEKLNAQAQATSDVADAAKSQATTSNTIAAATQESATTAKDALEDQTRPWVKVEGMPEITDPNDTGMTYPDRLNARIMNLGPSPATNVTSAFGVIDQGGMPADYFGRYDPCKDADILLLQIWNDRTKYYFNGSTIFPGTDGIISQARSISWVSVPISPLDLVEESSHEVPTTFLVDT